MIKPGYMMNTELQAQPEQVRQMIQAIAEDDPQDTTPPNQFKASSGVVFKIKKVSPLLLKDAQERLIEPRPPKVYLEDKETHEDNPSDPDYQDKLRQFQILQAETSHAVLLTMGTAVESIPDDVDGIDATAWVETVEEIIGIEVPKTPRRRYFCWVKYVAITDMADFFGLLRKITRLSGFVTEEAVAQAAASFRSSENGRADTELQPPPKIGHGDNNSAGDVRLRA